MNEIIQVYTDTNEGQISVSISFTSFSIQQITQTSGQFLTKKNCLNALYAVYSVRWFQVKKNKICFFILFLICRIKLVNDNMHAR